MFSSITAIFPSHKIWFQDITQAYIKGQDLQREFYLEPDDQFKLPRNTYLKLLNPLYGLSKSGDSCFHKCKDFLKNELHQQTENGDLSFIIKRITPVNYGALYCICRRHSRKVIPQSRNVYNEHQNPSNPRKGSSIIFNCRNYDQ